MPGIGYVEQYQVESIVIMNKTFWESVMLTKRVPRIGYVDHRRCRFVLSISKIWCCPNKKKSEIK